MSSKVQTMAASDGTKPRRFDLSMSRRTRRPASLTANCHQQDQDQAQDAALNAALPPSQCLCLSDHLLQSQHSEATKESETQQQEDCQDNSRSFSLQELIEDEAADGDKDAVATGGVAEAAAAAAAVEKSPEPVAGRRVIGMMRRYVRVRSIKIKHAAEKNVAPIC